jgi:acetyl-CoA carboxylase biotin carboxylase subunit
VAKLIAHGNDRTEAIRRMLRALDMFIIEGIHTSIPLHRRILSDPEFQAARIDTDYINRFLGRKQSAFSS